MLLSAVLHHDLGQEARPGSGHQVEVDRVVLLVIEVALAVHRSRDPEVRERVVSPSEARTLLRAEVRRLDQRKQAEAGLAVL